MAWQKEWKTGDGKPVKSNVEVKHVREHLGQTIVGDLALDFTDEGWNIYHVPTGACFDKAVPPIHPAKHEDDIDYQYSKDQLLNWMKKVQEANPTAWTMLRLLTKDNYATNGTAAKKIIQEWCLSVKVE